jgi:hypothetical protein
MRKIQETLKKALPDDFGWGLCLFKKNQIINYSVPGGQ